MPGIDNDSSQEAVKISHGAHRTKTGNLLFNYLIEVNEQKTFGYKRKKHRVEH